VSAIDAPSHDCPPTADRRPAVFISGFLSRGRRRRRRRRRRSSGVYDGAAMGKVYSRLTECLSSTIIRPLQLLLNSR